MKKILLFSAIALGAMSASAQAIEEPKLSDNVSIGINGGVATPMMHEPFFKAMRPIVGVNIEKQMTPTFAIGVESMFGVNTSSWYGREHSSTAFDDSYVGLYGKVDFFNLFGGYPCSVRPFTIEGVLGAGWGHYYVNKANGDDSNFLKTRAGLNFKINTSERVSVNIQPYVTWNMHAMEPVHSNVFSRQGAAFNITAGVSYRFGKGFVCVRPYDEAEVAALNAQINDLRASVQSSDERLAAADSRAKALEAELQACKNRAPQVIKEVSDHLSSVRYVFFRNGSAVVTPDQQPNIEMIAAYLNNHPDAKVVVRGYASKEGNYEFNVKLAQRRADAVKTALMKRFKIAADRIQAEGQGIGEMFSEQSWNRVSICTLEDAK